MRHHHLFPPSFARSRGDTLANTLNITADANGDNVISGSIDTMPLKWVLANDGAYEFPSQYNGVFGRDGDTTEILNVHKTPKHGRKTERRTISVSAVVGSALHGRN